MRTIIAGTRTIEDRALVEKAISRAGHLITMVLCGGAKGVDTVGRNWALDKGIPVKYFIANWPAHEKAAGPIRNREMAENADALVAVHDGQSRGTKSMIGLARQYGLHITTTENT